MFNNEKQFEELINSLPLDDQINHQHKELLEKQLLEQFVPAAQSRQHTTNNWSSIMKNRITHIAAAAVLLIVVSIFWANTSNSPAINPLKMLENVCHAENAFFSSSGITHIITAIKVFPLPDELRKEYTLTDETNIEEMQGTDLWYNHNWLPTCSLKSDGEFRLNEFKLPYDNSKEFTITDQAWHDPVTGHFKRIMEKDGQVIMANTWDGSLLQEIFRESGKVKTISGPTTNDFRAPINPADFLGLGVGVCGALASNESAFSSKYIGEKTLKDGTPVDIYSYGFPDQKGDVTTSWIFKVDQLSGLLYEMEFYISGNRQILIKRVLNEKIEQGPDSWSIAEEKIAESETNESDDVSMNSDMYVDNVTVKHMMEKASYPTYVFNKLPKWCTQRKIYDVVDPPSPGHRMFMVDYFNDKDNKHVMLIQSKTYNGMFVNFLKDDVDRLGAYLKSDKKHYVYHGGPQEKWWTKVVLDSCQIEPDENRAGYLVWTGSETIPALVINGATTQQELQEILDSLVTSEEYLKNHTE